MHAFTPLRVHSHGSLLYGTASPEVLIERALLLGHDALALTDRDNLYLAIRFWRAARAEGLRPLPGCLLTHGPHEALLLPVDRRGYAHLCELITRRHLDARFDLVAALAPPDAPALWPGLHVIVESPGLAASLQRAGVPAARGTFAPGTRAPDAGLWIGVRGIAGERRVLAGRAAAARGLGLPLIATGDAVLLSPADRDAHRVAVTAAAGELIERMPDAAFCAPDAVLAAPDAWARRVRAVCAGAGVPQAADEALAHNHALVERCRLEIDLGVPIFPRAPLAAGETGPGRLRALCEAGLARRYPACGAPPPDAPPAHPGSAPANGAPSGGRAATLHRARRRLDEELAMIERMGFTDYFLLVAEIVGFARARGIPTAGRGSGASSIVAYALGITNVDPIRYGLFFERFLNPARRDCPDLDIDLCWWRRDDVIRHVYDTYGHDRVAMICTHATLGARSAFRETARALGVPNARVNALAHRIPRDLEHPYAPRLRALPGACDVDWSEPPLARALELAARLDGAPRHLSVHSGGVVIADRPLTHYVPLERAAKDVVVTQFEMRAIEAVGLVKMDLLGNRALSTIAECVELARSRRPEPGAGPDLDRVPDPDPPTAARLAAGDTLGCFQLESPAMRHLLRMLDARTLDDTIAAVALVRPGPAESGMKEAYCRRARGAEPAGYLHPRLEPVLRATHGIMLYEEDVMRVAAALTGISLAEGDDLRRAIGAARTDEEFRSLERGFVAQAARGGVDTETARAVWRELTRFAAYAFCRAHAAGYGTLGYHSAYLKTRWPAEYAVALLNHHAGMYPTWVHVEDLRRRGVEFRAPCVTRSEWRATLETGAGPVGTESGPAPAFPSEPDAALVARTGRDGVAARIGLARVFGLHRSTADRIVAARAERGFGSFADFIDRTRPSLPEAESLVHAGALDALGRSRPSLLLEARAGARAWARAGVLRARQDAAATGPHAAPGTVALAMADGRPLAPDPVAPVAVPELPEFDAADRVRHEFAATGLWFSAHPLDALAPPAARRGTVPAAGIWRHAGRRIALAGMPCASRRVETRQGGLMLFVTLADRSGLAECVLFPDACRRLAGIVRAGIVRIEGRVDGTLNALTVVVERAQAFGDDAWIDEGERAPHEFGRGTGH